MVTEKVYKNNAWEQVDRPSFTTDSSSATRSMNPNQFTTVHTATITKGVWIVTGVVKFNLNANQQDIGYIQFKRGDTQYDFLRERRRLITGGGTDTPIMSIIRIFEVEDTTSIPFQVLFNGSISYTWIQAVKIA